MSKYRITRLRPCAPQEFPRSLIVRRRPRTRRGERGSHPVGTILTAWHFGRYGGVSAGVGCEPGVGVGCEPFLHFWPHQASAEDVGPCLKFDFFGFGGAGWDEVPPGRYAVVRQTFRRKGRQLETAFSETKGPGAQSPYVIFSFGTRHGIRKPSFV